MQRFYAERLLRISKVSGMLNQACQAGYSEEKLSRVLRSTGTMDDVRQFAEDCRELALNVSAAEIERLLYGLERDLTGNQLAEQAHCVIKVLESELAERHFLSIRSGYGDRLLPLPHFGEAVARVFPLATHDISEAAACLALERYQGCVFHSMLVLEHGLRWMCKKLRVRFPPYEQWERIIQLIETEIAKLNPPKKNLNKRQLRDFLADAAAHLRVVKEGWRNSVSHGRGGAYGPEKAEAIYNAVRQFMGELAEYQEKKSKRNP